MQRAEGEVRKRRPAARAHRVERRLLLQRRATSSGTSTATRAATTRPRTRVATASRTWHGRSVSGHPPASASAVTSRAGSPISRSAQDVQQERRRSHRSHLATRRQRQPRGRAGRRARHPAPARRRLRRLRERRDAQQPAARRGDPRQQRRASRRAWSGSCSRSSTCPRRATPVSPRRFASPSSPASTVW